MNAPTVRDLLARAGSTDGSDREAAVMAAWDLAARGTRYPASDWRDLLSWLVEAEADPERIRACADHVVAASVDAVDAWGFAEAIVALHATGDAARVDEVTRRARATLEAGSDRAYHWGLLAQGIQSVPALVPTARALVERGAALARDRADFDGLAGFAARLGSFDDVATGARWAAEAEALWRARDGRTVRDAWCLANAWHALGLLHERDRLLADVAAAATTLDDRLILARIWASHGEARATDVVADALALARSAADWYQLAECAQACDADREVVSRALVAARAAAPDATLRAEIDRAAHAWLGVHPDHATSVRPEDLRPRRRLLPGWPSSSSGLLDWLCDRMDDARIAAIAEADYGMDARDHHAALVTLVRDRVVPPTLPWVPGEVLRLRRWDQGERVDHVARAFCAAVLLLYGEDAVLNAGILLESVRGLDPAATPLAVALLVDLYEREPDAWPALRYGIALTAHRAGRPPDPIAALLEDEVDPEALAAEVHGLLSADAWRGASTGLPPGAPAALARVAEAVAG